MKRNLLLITLVGLFSFFEVFSQVTSFSDDGKLTEFKHMTYKKMPKSFLGISYKIKKRQNSIAPFSVASLTTSDFEIKKTNREILIKKIEETISLLSGTPEKESLRRFYAVLWPGATIPAIQIYLGALKTYLTDQVTVPPGGISWANEIGNPIRSNLLETSPSVFSIASNPDLQTISLYKKDVFNGFLVDYFNETIRDASGINFSVERYLTHLNSFTINKKTVDSLLSIVRKKVNIFDADLYRAMRNLHAEITNPNNPFQITTNEFRENDWFKKWFWLRGGEIRLNPLDFTTDDFVNLSPRYDISKATLFDDYIDTMIQRHLRNDSVENVERFKSLIQLKGQGKNTFSLQKRLDSLSKLNEKQKTALIKNNRLLNKVVIPENGEMYQVSALENMEIEGDKKYFKKALRTEEFKTIVIHNLPGNAKGGLIEDNTDLTDRSAFTIGFDTVVSMLGQVALLVSKYTPYATFLDALLPITFGPGNIAIAPTLSLTNLAARQTEMTRIRESVAERNRLDIGDIVMIDIYRPYNLIRVPDFLKEYFTGNDIFDVDIFEAMRIDPAIMTSAKRIGQLDYRNTDDQFIIDLIQAFINEYQRQIIEKEFNSLVEDSTLITNYVRIFSNSTLPSTVLLKSGKDNNPFYNSKILKTKTSEKSITKNVTIYSYVGKDTVKIDNISTRIGKNFRFQLSGGVCYTLNSYSQLQVKQDNDQISVKNDIQQYRFVVGLNIYLGKSGIFLQDNRFLGRFGERISVLIGVSIPNPLENIYCGLSYDLWPGFKINSGVHVIKSNNYLIQNNIIVEEHKGYKAAGPFVGISIDPTSLLNLLNVFQKK